MLFERILPEIIYTSWLQSKYSSRDLLGAQAFLWIKRSLSRFCIFYFPVSQFRLCNNQECQFFFLNAFIKACLYSVSRVKLERFCIRKFSGSSLRLFLTSFCFCCWVFLCSSQMGERLRLSFYFMLETLLEEIYDLTMALVLIMDSMRDWHWTFFGGNFD